MSGRIERPAVARVRGIIAATGGMDPHDPEANAVDLIADVLHYAAATGSNPATVVRVALDHYQSETETNPMQPTDHYEKDAPLTEEEITAALAEQAEDHYGAEPTEPHYDIAERRRRTAALVFAVHGQPEPDNEPEPETARFMLVELGTSNYRGRRWYSTGNDPAALLERHDTQEYPEDWWAPAVYDLEAREAVLVERRYQEIGRSAFRAREEESYR